MNLNVASFTLFVQSCQDNIQNNTKWVNNHTASLAAFLHIYDQTILLLYIHWLIFI